MSSLQQWNEELCRCRLAVLHVVRFIDNDNLSASNWCLNYVDVVTSNITSNMTSITEVRSTSTHLFAGTVCGASWWVLLQHSIKLRLFSIILCGIVCFLCAMRVFEVWASSSSPRLDYVSFAASIAELAYGEKSRTQSLNHSPSLFDANSDRCLVLKAGLPDKSCGSSGSTVILHNTKR